jgi:hypothetical protein
MITVTVEVLGRDVHHVGAVAVDPADDIPLLVLE